MSVTIKPLYAAAVAFTITLASLADAACRECTAIINTSNLYLDAMLSLAFKLQAGTPAASDGGQPRIEIYAYQLAEGTIYTDNATGTDAALTMRVPTNLMLIGIIYTPDAGALTYKGVLASIAAGFGGVMPAKWGIVVRNMTGCAFSATAGDHTAKYVGVQASAISA